MENNNFDVFELISDLKPIGHAKYINDNEIRIEFEDRILILKNKKNTMGRKSIDSQDTRL